MQQTWDAGGDDADSSDPPPPPYSETAGSGEQVVDELHAPGAAAPQPSSRAPPPAVPSPTEDAYGGMEEPVPHTAPGAPGAQPGQRRLGFLNAGARHWSESLPIIDPRGPRR